MEEGVGDNKTDKSENNDERKEAECVDDRKIKKRRNNEKKNEDETTDTKSTTMDEVKGMKSEKGGKDFDLDQFDESTCSGDTYYDFLITRKKLLQKMQIVWVNINKTI